MTLLRLFAPGFVIEFETGKLEPTNENGLKLADCRGFLCLETSCDSEESTNKRTVTKIATL